MVAYYNEIDPAAAHILRHLIAENVIAPGEVDTRSIKEVQPNDLIGFTQCHFFAGGGLWSVAARLAGWPDDEPLWTGSCPCQPFSAAGKGLGSDDPRHLWPDFYRLIRARRPVVVVGEQVAGAAGYGWFDGVRLDLANEGFASRTVDFPACSVDAPHQRNRQYWAAIDMVHAESVGRRERWSEPEFRGWWPTPSGANASVREVANGAFFGQQVSAAGRQSSVEGAVGSDNQNGGIPSDAPVSVVQGQPSTGNKPDARKDEGIYADADRSGRSGWQESAKREPIIGASFERHLLRNGTYWSDAEWIACHDGKARRAEPGIRFLVDGLLGRVDLWRVGGNAIVPQAAAEVLGSLIDVYGLPSAWGASA